MESIQFTVKIIPQLELLRAVGTEELFKAIRQLLDKKKTDFYLSVEFNDNGQ